MMSRGIPILKEANRTRHNITLQKSLHFNQGRSLPQICLHFNQGRSLPRMCLLQAADVHVQDYPICKYTHLLVHYNLQDNNKYYTTWV
jgi:hypothetical protein